MKQYPEKIQHRYKPGEISIEIEGDIQMDHRVMEIRFYLAGKFVATQNTMKFT